ncbi:unnamed protein product [Protopolystoma xenopodis]|uniref:Tryptophan synthase beta chain-like PALP domain-containing protein n=1 Tax=Protopolystoma xenopodis TaxID=117903 RepID=A0A448WCP6_9PLAT|nr:unnamed protein product [Protopolystoma xenopodis]
MDRACYDHPFILAGQGTVALEVLEQVPNLEAILVPVGGGGLLAGCAVTVRALSPQVKIIVSSICFSTT